MYIFQHVTIGDRYDGSEGRPIICSGSVVYAGAVVAGSVTIGPNAVVGAQAFVTRNVHEGETAYGPRAHIQSPPEIMEIVV